LKPIVETGNKTATKKHEELQKKIKKLKRDLEDYDGWKKDLFLSGGSVDLEFDLDPLPMKQQVEVLKKTKEWLIKHVAEEKGHAGKAFQEVDLRCVEVEGDLMRREREVERLKGQIEKLRAEIKRKEEEIKEKEKDDTMVGAIVENESVSKEQRIENLKQQLKQLQRKTYRERLAVNELLSGLNGLGDCVVDLCTTQEGMEVVGGELEKEEGGWGFDPMATGGEGRGEGTATAGYKGRQGATRGGGRSELTKFLALPCLSIPSLPFPRSLRLAA